jgi:hypothetical protein
VSGDLTKEQAAIIGAYTGVLVGPFAEMHEYIEKILGRSVWTHELANDSVCEEIKRASHRDLMSIVRSVRR